ncbi:MAG: hypothetical protein HZA14_02015 [Nitrospirae bacterium]|nr:hypothetical protein [Nitrospirota bacterium]
MEGDIEATLEDIDEKIVHVVEKVNSTTSQISQLNDKIVQLEAGFDMERASYLRDQRDQLLNELAGLMDYTWYEDDNGGVTIMTGGKGLVTPQGASTLSTAVDSEGERKLYLNGKDVTSFFTKGQLGGYMDVMDDIKDNPLINLQRLVASVINEVNIVHRQGYGIDTPSSTNNNFFDALQIYTKDYSAGAYIDSAVISNPATLTLDEYDISFTGAANYVITNHQTGATVASGAYTPGGTISFEGIDVVIDGAAAAGDSFFVSPLSNVIENFDVSLTDAELEKIAASDSDTAVSGKGNNENALRIYELYHESLSDLSGASFESYYRGIVSNVGVMSKSASDGLSFDDNMLFELQKKREEASGVSIDEEAANLIRYQRAFEAGARILKMTDELLETLINL